MPRSDEHAGDARRLTRRQEAEDKGRRGDGRDDLGAGGLRRVDGGSAEGRRRKTKVARTDSQTTDDTDLDTERSEVGETTERVGRDDLKERGGSVRETRTGDTRC